MHQTQLKGPAWTYYFVKNGD